MAYTMYQPQAQQAFPSYPAAFQRTGCGCGGSTPVPYAQQGMQLWPQMMQQAQPQMMPQMPQAQQGTVPPQVSSGNLMTPTGTVLPIGFEQSYVENILRMNLGKVGTFYMTYENNSEWNAKIFRGVVEAAGRDHIIISDPVTGQRIILLTLNLDYITFDEPLAYEYPGVVGNPARPESE